MSAACYCDYETPAFYSVTYRIARQAHVCAECHGHIAPGERYRVSAGKWDGTFAAHKWCPDCTALFDHVEAHVPCWCWCFGSMRDDALGTLDAYGHEAPGLWFAGARLIIKGRRRRAARNARSAS